MGNIRVVGEDGLMSNMGRPELRTDQGWGSICGLNHHAAAHICRQIGYKNGWKIPAAKCGVLCGPRGSPVACKNLVCPGDEDSVQGCKRMAADKDCKTHQLDSLVYVLVPLDVILIYWDWNCNISNCKEAFFTIWSGHFT